MDWWTGGICDCCFKVWFLVLPIGIAKAAPVSVIASILTAVSCFFISLVHVPITTCQGIYAICVTKRYGRNMKCLAILCMPFCAVSYVPAITVGGFIVGLLGSFVWVFGATCGCIMDNKWCNLLCIGICGEHGVFSMLCGLIYDLWDSHVRFFQRCLKPDLIEFELSPWERPFDIPCFHILVAPFLGLLGMVIDLLLFTYLGCLWFVMYLLRGMKNICWIVDNTCGYIMQNFCWIIVFFPIWAIGLCLFIVGVPLVFLVFIPLCGIPMGLRAPFTSYHTRSICAGLAQIFVNAAELDEQLAEGARLNPLRFLPCICSGCKNVAKREASATTVHPEGAGDAAPAAQEIGPAQEIGRHRGPRPRRPRVPHRYLREGSRLGQIAGSLDVDFVWDHFFTQCLEVGRELLKSDRLKHVDIENREANLFLGLPAIVVERMMMRSLDLEGNAFRSADKIEVTDANRPRNPIADIFWTPLCKCKAAFKEIAPLTAPELDAIEHSLINQKGIDPDKEKIDKDRLLMLNRAVAATNSVAIPVSQSPTFKTRFESVLDTLSSESPA